MHFKPDGYSSVSPYLVVSDAAATIRFLEKALGAQLLRSFPNSRGGIMHAEVRIDDSVIMIADAQPDWPDRPTHVHVYVPDVEAAYATALSAGAESVQEPTRKGDGDKRCGVRDSGGTTWWIATGQSS